MRRRAHINEGDICYAEPAGQADEHARMYAQALYQIHDKIHPTRRRTHS